MNIDVDVFQTNSAASADDRVENVPVDLKDGAALKASRQDCRARVIPRVGADDADLEKLGVTVIITTEIRRFRAMAATKFTGSPRWFD
jgi:esterase/lipase superfamily enzyme